MRTSDNNQMIINHKENICNNCAYFCHNDYGFIKELDNIFLSEECLNSNNAVKEAFDYDKGIIKECVGFKKIKKGD